MTLFIVSGCGVVTQAPRLRLRRAVVMSNEVVTVPLPAEVQQAIRDAEQAAFQSVRVALAPFGLTPWDIAAPTYRRVLTEDEVPFYVRTRREQRKGQ